MLNKNKTKLGGVDIEGSDIVTKINIITQQISQE